MSIETEIVPPVIDRIPELLAAIQLYCAARDKLIIPEGLDNATHVQLNKDYWGYIKTVREHIDKIMSEIPGADTDLVEDIISKIKALPNFK